MRCWCHCASLPGLSGATPQGYNRACYVRHYTAPRASAAPVLPSIHAVRCRVSARAVGVPQSLAADHVSRRVASLWSPSGNCGRAASQSSHHRQWRNRLQQDHPVAQDLPAARTWRQWPDRPHAATPDCRLVHRQADCPGTRLRSRRTRGLQGALQ